MRMLRGVAGGALALMVAACGGDSGGGAGGGTGTVVVGMRSDFGGFNPVTSSGQYDMEVMNYALFTPLVQYDENLGVQPWLAESWEVHGDTGVTFRLRNDVRWHDGQPVTAHDVKFTFDLAKNEETASLVGSAFIADVASADVVDDHTIRFSFARPHAQVARGLLVAADAAASVAEHRARRHEERAVQSRARRQWPVQIR